MKLSDAILIGSAIVKPRPGKVYRPEENSGCAIGMAVIGAGGKWIQRGLDSVEFLHWWPWVNNSVKRPCRCQSVRPVARVGSLIPHLFDRHVFGQCDWTIEQLAEWIATIEPPEQDLTFPPDVPIDVVRTRCVARMMILNQLQKNPSIILSQASTCPGMPRKPKPKPEGAPNTDLRRSVAERVLSLFSSSDQR